MRDPGLTFVEFQEMLAERRREFVECELTEEKLREFLARNGFTATEIMLEIADAKAAKEARTQEVAQDFLRRARAS